MSRISFKKRGEVVATLPKVAYIAVARLQLELELDWEQACVEAARMVEASEQKLNSMARARAESLAKSKLMRRLNASRKSIRDKAWQEGYRAAESAPRKKIEEKVRENEDNFRVPCLKCGVLRFSNRDTNWKKIGSRFTKHSPSWIHDECQR